MTGAVEASSTAATAARVNLRMRFPPLHEWNNNVTSYTGTWRKESPASRSHAAQSVDAVRPEERGNRVDEPARVDRLRQVDLKAGGARLVGVLLPRVDRQRDRRRGEAGAAQRSHQGVAIFVRHPDV